MKKIRSLNLLLLLTLIGAAVVFGNSGRLSEANNSKLDQELLLDKFNEYRNQGAQCGRQFHEPVPPFSWSGKLENVAQQYSDALHANRNNPAFEQRGGFDLQTALRNAEYDYVSFYHSYASLTSNFTEEIFVSWLMDNAGACSNIMDEAYVDIAVTKTDLFWVVLLAAPKIPHYWNLDSININILVQETNKYRRMGARCGNQDFPPVEAVVWSERLAQAAQLHSDDMNENQFFEHVGTGGSTPVARLDKAGYRYRSTGENIAMGEVLTEETVIEGWMNSPYHCRNIMNASFTEMGVARSGAYWTQVFGRPWSD